MGSQRLRGSFNRLSLLHMYYMSMRGFRNLLVMSRARVQVVSFASATLGIFLGADTFREVLSIDVLVYILLFFTLITFACNINCVFDVAVDRLRKRQLAAAVMYFGKKRMRDLLVTEAVVATTLSVFLIFRGHWEVALLALFGLYFGWAYSSPPLRIKGKGAIGPIPVVLGVYVAPILAGYLLVNRELTLLFLGFVTGYAVMNLGINLVNTCEDYTEDRILFGGGVALWCLLGMGYPRLMQVSQFTLLALLFYVTSIVTVLFTSHDIMNVGDAANLEKSAKLHAWKMPKWFVITRYPMWLYALTLLFL